MDQIARENGIDRDKIGQLCNVPRSAGEAVIASMILRKRVSVGIGR